MDFELRMFGSRDIDQGRRGFHSVLLELVVTTEFSILQLACSRQARYHEPLSHRSRPTSPHGLEGGEAKQVLAVLNSHFLPPI
jgi:hypothetical protein